MLDLILIIFFFNSSILALKAVQKTKITSWCWAQFAERLAENPTKHSSTRLLQMMEDLQMNFLWLADMVVVLT